MSGRESSPRHTDAAKARLQARYARLERGRRSGPLVAIVQRFRTIDGSREGGLLALELFTTMIPLMVIGFSSFKGFSNDASPGDLFIHELNIGQPLDRTVRAAFGSTANLRSEWTVIGLAGFLVWGIPMSLTVARTFGLAWRREEYGLQQRLWRGLTWFVLYLAVLGTSLHIELVIDGNRAVLFAVSTIPVLVFWSLTPVLLVRDGARGLKYLALAGLAGMIIDGVVLRLGSQIFFPWILKGWTSFGPIGVAMTLLTWCGVIGTGWVITACAGAIVWERSAPPETVITTQADYQGDE
jgi:uncharacterized BrkB/YihY/UPF0761 family membrane protein